MSLWDKTSKLPEFLNYKDRRRVVATDQGFVIGRTYTDVNNVARNKQEILVAIESLANTSNFNSPVITDVWFDATKNAPNTTFNVYSGDSPTVTAYVSFDEPLHYANSTVGSVKLVIANTTAGAVINAASNTSQFFGANNQLKFDFTPVAAGTYTVQAQTLANATSTSIASLVTMNASNTAPSYTVNSSMLTTVGTFTVTANLTISGTPANTGTHGTAYSWTATGAGGYAPLTYDVAAGSLPSGVTVNATSGVVGGTLAANSAGSYNGIVIRVTDSKGHTANLDSYDLTVS